MILLWFACITVDDCLYFDDCIPYRPEGLDCGLAHNGLEHHGGACGTGFDPAWTRNTYDVQSAGTQPAPCPEGYALEQFLDDAGDNTGWYSCVALGNLNHSSGKLRDLPAGISCGLSSMVLTVNTCEGFVSADGECPPHYQFRWVIDRYIDRTNSECKRDPNSGFAFNQVRVLTFCELEAGEDAGCTLENCPDYLTVDARRGMLCGLHNRNDYFYNGSAENLPLVDQEQILEDWIRPCSPYDIDFQRLLPILERTANEDPQCMGKPVREGCPTGMELVCSGEWVTNRTNPEAYAPDLNSLCWCDIPGQAQKSYIDL